MQTEALNQLYAELAEKLIDDAVKEVKPPAPKPKTTRPRRRANQKVEESDKGSRLPQISKLEDDNGGEGSSGQQ